MNRALSIALAASLAANVFLGGFWAGRFVGVPLSELHHRPPVAAGPMGYDVSILGEAQRHEFHKVFSERHEELRAQMRDLRSARRAFAEALAAETWNREQAESALQSLRAAESVQQEAFGALLIDAFENLSADERKALVEAQRKRRKMRHVRGLVDHARPPTQTP